MLNNYISKLVSLITLCAFLFQPQWLERSVSHKASQQHPTAFTKASKSTGYTFSQITDENESDDDSEILISEISSKITPFFPALTEQISHTVYFQCMELHRLQERPVWLIFRKLIL